MKARKAIKFGPVKRYLKYLHNLKFVSVEARESGESGAKLS
jgi:hypothetical protein